MSDSWPINFDSLEIGSRVTAEEITRFCNLEPNDPNYRLKGQLTLATMIRAKRPDLDQYIRSQGNDVIVMNDSEAAHHQEKQGKQSLRRFITSHVRNSKVDPASLSEEDLAKHEGTIYRNGRYISALNTARKELQLTPHQSTKPKPSLG